MPRRITVKCKFFKNRKDGRRLKNLLGEENISFFLSYSLRHKYRRFEGETFDRKGYKTGRICSIWDSQLHTFLLQKVLGEFCGVLYFSGDKVPFYLGVRNNFLKAHLDLQY